jgi:hypothetical protein
MNLSRQDEELLQLCTMLFGGTIFTLLTRTMYSQIIWMGISITTFLSSISDKNKYHKIEKNYRKIFTRSHVPTKDLLWGVGACPT